MVETTTERSWLFWKQTQQGTRSWRTNLSMTPFALSRKISPLLHCLSHLPEYANRPVVFCHLVLSSMTGSRTMLNYKQLWDVAISSGDDSCKGKKARMQLDFTKREGDAHGACVPFKTLRLYSARPQGSSHSETLPISKWWAPEPSQRVLGGYRAILGSTADSTAFLVLGPDSSKELIAASQTCQNKRL